MKVARRLCPGLRVRGVVLAVLGFVVPSGGEGSAAAAVSGLHPLDLRRAVNMGWRDETAGDGRGGWSDQGRNDMRQLEPGRKTLLGVPFDLIDPATNGGKAVLVLKSRNFPNGVASCRVLVGAKAASLVFLHAAAWNRGHMATYVVHYADGTRAEIPIRAGHEIANWWRPRDGGSYRAALHVANPECNDVGLVAFAWRNPSPAKPIAALEFRSLNATGVPIVAAVTRSDKPLTLASAKPKGKAVADPAGIAHRVADSMHTPAAARVLKELGPKLAADRDQAVAVLDLLAENPSIDAATARAELLVWIARGDETPGWRRPKVKPREMPTDTLCRRAATLLAYDDPFVCALAEWAIALRMGVGHELRDTPWPNENAPAWYHAWRKAQSGRLLELDYARQGAALGVHRTSAALLRSAADIERRASGLAAYAREHDSPQHRAAVADRLAALAGAHQKLRAHAAARPDDLTGQRRCWLILRRAARDLVLANPDLDFRRILFATRSSANGGNITNGHLRDTYQPHGDIYVKGGFAPDDPARPLIAGRLGPGHLRGMDLWWNADRLVFSFLKQPGDRRSAQWAHLHEMRIDGGGLRQLTDARYNSDMEPIYLPNGDLVFASDRSNYGSQCAGTLLQDKMILNLWRCSPDGTNVQPLSNNKDFDRHPHVLDNGQILFLHWEYQERHLWQTHTLWTCRPDGSYPDAFYKQHITSGPMSLREARPVPGTRSVVAIACGHHNWEQGAVFLATPQLGVNTEQGMLCVTPGCSRTEGGYGRARTVPEGGVPDATGHYQYPYPLSRKSFLVAYSSKLPADHTGTNFALYYIDVWGHKELIHRDPSSSVAYLMPLRRRPVPPIIPDVADEPQRFATVYVQDVHRGLDGVDHGTVKYLRVAQHMPWPCVREQDKHCKFNDLHYAAAGAWTPVFGAWAWSPARVIGIVPVEPDGSAHFKVPVDQPVYFQALDASFLEVRRMRSFVMFQDGERRGCVGCHETRAAAPSAKQPSMLALRRTPSHPQPPSWGDRVVPGFDRHIQPILSRHCTKCHGAKSPKGGLDLSPRIVDHYPQSYRTLFGLKPSDPTPVASQDGWRYVYEGKRQQFNRDAIKKMARNEHPGQLVTISDRFSGAEISQPREFGSARSKLILTLLGEKHRERAKLTRDEWIALVTWVDLNAPYFDSYTDKDRFRTQGKARYVRVLFPDPWERAPFGEWIWKSDTLVELAP